MITAVQIGRYVTRNASLFKKVEVGAILWEEERVTNGGSDDSDPDDHSSDGADMQKSW